MPALNLRSAALSDIGKVRKENEDRVIHEVALGLFGVADGVGGLPGGAEAAQCAAEKIIAAVQALGPRGPIDFPTIINAANLAVATLGRELSPGMGIATTLTIGSIRQNLLRLAHVGDSRCYAWRRGEFIALTEDHSVENEARHRRDLGEVVYYHPSQRAALTRCLGQPIDLEIDQLERPVLAGDRYLFLTDGVTRMLKDWELSDILANAKDPATAMDKLVGLAVGRGGPDNASGVAIFADF